MANDQQVRANVSMFIGAGPAGIYDAFVKPEWLTQFWLSKSTGPLDAGKSVEWSFKVPGAQDTVTATCLDQDKCVEWQWSDGSVTRVDLEPFEDGTIVTITTSGFSGSDQEVVAAALDNTEGFTIVLCDLKTLLESGQSAGLTAAKARLISSRMDK